MCSNFKALSQMCVRICVCLSVRPSIRVKQLGSHWTDFREI